MLNDEIEAFTVFGMHVIKMEKVLQSESKACLFKSKENCK